MTISRSNCAKKVFLETNLYFFRLSHDQSVITSTTVMIKDIGFKGSEVDTYKSKKIKTRIKPMRLNNLISRRYLKLSIIDTG